MSAINAKLSLFIPHVFPNFSEEYVTEVFETHLNLGKVSHIDFIEKEDKHGQAYNAAYVHFTEWFQTEQTVKFQQNVCSEKGARIIYDDPWFWMVLENKKKKNIPGERKPRLDLSENVEVTAPVIQKPVLKRDTNMPEMDFPDMLPAPKTAPMPPVSLQELLKMPDENGFTEEDYAKMNELEDYMDEQSVEDDDEDKTLISIDSRYVEELEAENAELREQVRQLTLMTQQYHMAYQLEATKSYALAKFTIE